MKLCTFYKIKETGVSKYLFDLFPEKCHLYNTPSLVDVTTFYCSTDVFKYSFFHILLWNKTSLIGRYGNLKLCCLLEMLC